ncbi:hypothetical protein JCM31447_12710 [Fluviispira sanaruensis]|uniref:Uncharacterized protein n=2 Tax=Fluviispira sanaruensis TaxID=2493639 RepID=A0A4P2VJV4_FLUSA|nr:hypothetical protein JCM31447_12710 [Fluviispira sanaruensis]
MEVFLKNKLNLLLPNVDPANQVFVLYAGEPFIQRNNPAIQALLTYYSEETGAFVEAISNSYIKLLNIITLYQTKRSLKQILIFFKIIIF